MLRKAYTEKYHSAPTEIVYYRRHIKLSDPLCANQSFRYHQKCIHISTTITSGPELR